MGIFSRISSFFLGRKESISVGQIERPADDIRSRVFQNWIARKVSPTLYEALRESISIIDVGIHRLVTLDGIVRFRGKDKKLVQELEDWASEVQVNDMQKGLQSFINNFSNETYEQGFSISEFVVTPSMDDIVRLNVADSKDILFRRAADGTLEVWYRGRSHPAKTRNWDDLMEAVLSNSLSAQEVASRLNAHGYTQLTTDNLLYYSIDNENHNPYGTSMLRSTEFVSKVLLTIENSVLNTWDRFGDPSYCVKYKTSRRDLGEETLEGRRKKIEQTFQEVIKSKRAGRSGDFIAALDKDSDILIEIIGHDNQVLEVEAPARFIVEQIVARFKLPPWLLGLHWSTTERLAKFEAEILLQEAKTRAANKLPVVERLIRTLLKLRGVNWKRGDWEVYFEFPNLHDLVAQAQARFLNAQADMYYLERGMPEMVQNREDDKRLSFQKDHCGCTHTKETRPVPMEEVDRIEQEFLARMLSSWKALEQRVREILGVEPVKRAKSDDHIELDDEKEEQINRAFDDFLDEWDPDEDEEEKLKYYYSNAYVAGAAAAAKMTGLNIPILDILEALKQLSDYIEEGFEVRIRDNNTLRVKDLLIERLREIPLARRNPIRIARVIADTFGGANSSWERLIRSEVAFAAERGKLDEFREEGVKKIRFVAAGDACPLCKSLAKVYEADKVPLPVRDTHPRCYCTLVAE